MRRFPMLGFWRVIALVLLLALPVLLVGCELLQPVGANPTDAGNYELKVVVLDVGQGDSILLASDGQYMLIDAGENDKGDDVVEQLKQLGITRLKAVVGTHPHSDHIGGLDTVIDTIPVDAVYLPRLTADTETYEGLLDAIDKAGLAITSPKPGDKTELGLAEITFLWPPAKYNSDNTNNHSIVMMVSVPGCRLLLCGDIEKGVETSLLKQDIELDCDVLKVAHHGSDTSSTKAFLEVATPRIALISVGQGNKFKHPDRDALERLQGVGAEIHRTDLEGTLTLTVTDGTLAVSGSNP